MADDFDSSLNLDYHTKYDDQSNLVSDVVGGAVATVADFGGSVWNSLPFTEEVETADILRKVDTNALRVYEENPDTIHAMSFIGGMFVPSGIALKGLNAARAGVKGVNWFSKAGKTEDLARIEALFAEGPTATKLYRQARNEYYLKGVANQALDAAVMEGAIIGTLNAHPLMEDYMEDPVKNFAISAAFGGVLGGAIGRISDGFAIKNLTGAVETGAMNTILGDFATAYKSTQNATQLQIQEANIKSLQKIVSSDDGVAYNGLVKANAQKILVDLQADQIERFEGMLSPELRAQTPEVQTEIMRMFKSNPATGGVDSIGYLTQKLDGRGTINPTIAETLALRDKPGFVTLTNKKTGEKKLSEVAYFPEFGRYGTPADAKHYARARDLGMSPAKLDESLGSNFGRLPNHDSYEEVFSKNSASIDKDYLAALARVNKMSAKELNELRISPDDLPMLNAVASRMKIQRIDPKTKLPEDLSKVNLTITRNQPNWGELESAVQKNAGVAKDYQSKVKTFTSPKGIKEFDLFEQNLSPAAYDMLRGWRSGSGIKKMRDAAEAFFRGGMGASSDMYNDATAFTEIYDSAASKALRNKFREIADPEGNVYLYRGLSVSKANGHASLESYSTDLDKATEFGRPQLYKVHVDDIVGGIADLASHDGVKKNEIIVGSPARQTVAELPVIVGQQVAKRASSTDTVTSLVDLESNIVSLKGNLINSMLAQSMPLETIAIRTNTPLETVRNFALREEGTTLDSAGRFREYDDASMMEEYLNPAKRSLKLTSEIRKESYGLMKAGLDTKLMNEMNREIIDSFLSESKSSIARSVGNLLFNQHKASLDMMRTEISNFVNSKAGNKFFTSTDAYVREMGSAGTVASVIGKDVQHIANEAVESVLKPVSRRMADIATDPVSLVEANTAINFNAGLSGYRVYKDRQFWTKEMVIDTKTGKKVEQLVPLDKDDNPYKIVSDKVDSMLKEMQNKGRELYNLKNTQNQILGKPNMNDIGFWVPSFNPKNKFMSYVWNAEDDTTKLLWGNTAEELLEAERVFTKSLPEDAVQSGTIRIVRKGDQALYNKLNGRNDAVTMDVANIEMQKGGATANANVKANLDAFTEMAEGYEHYINAQVRQLADLSMHDVTDLLDRMSSVNQQFFKGQALNPVAKLLQQPKDAAAVIKNTILGNSNLSEYQNWRTANQSFETGLSLAVDTVGKVWKAATDPLTKGFFGSKKNLTVDSLEKMDYEDLVGKLKKAGIDNPWAKFDEEAARMYGLAKLADHKDVSKRLVYASNAFAATVALRVGELAQPIVNAMSLPILTSLAIANKMPANFMGVQKSSAKVSGVQIMYEGARASNDPKFKALEARWTQLGYFKPLISEANETLAMSRSLDRGVISRVEKALDSNLVNIMSKPADWSETIVRRQTMFTGAVLAKRLYPELDDAGITIFARDFMDRAVGNYHAAQRPVMFQGTMGVALGLFQTYMLTLGQNVYRALEMKNYKAIGKAALAQTGIFGAGSLPGFHLVSNAIGEHFSDDNVDLQTGTYRAINDTAADFMLYGLPSNLGPAFYTRGEISPRVPNVVGGGVENIVGVNMMMQAGDMVKHVGSALGSDMPDVAQAFGEALSMQSMSRPLARGAELLTGHSVTRAGNTIATPEEVWTVTGVMSRVLSTRTMQEAKLREMQHLNTYYGSIDREARQELTGEIKTALRNGTLNDGLLSRIGEEYMRKGGTPTGWRSAVNTAVAQSNVSGKATLMSKLDPDSPFMHMMDSMD